MQYKTIALELICSRPKLHEQLRVSRTMLQAVDQYALSLKDFHESWMEQLRQTRPGSDPSQIASEALELALQDLQETLPNESADSDEATPI
jgi:hypothetical protein